ncbi:MAG: enoyl-CoA hydratase/isomerase family protein [Candidatus Obscuribacter sp.]|nr:enoyl-CoA hydratase/isomerase family protein [Candidatus Obscuribacter sp.]
MQKQLENTPGTASIALDEPAPGSTRTKLHQSEDFYVDLDENGIAGLWFACTKNANVLGQSTLDQLKIILDLLKKDTKVRGILLASAKKDHFVYGADLHEILGFKTFEQAHFLSSEGQKVFQELATLGKPVVAALHGACLGGGLEAALAATRRIASDHESTLLGLPEVRLGLIPGLGGTQRLPRLIPLRNALEFILTSEAVGAARALELGIVSEVVKHEDLFKRARDLALELVKGTAPEQPAKEEEKPEKAKTLFATMERSFRIRFKGNYPAPLKAIEAIKYALKEDILEGLDFEARAFAELAVDPTSSNLIQIFFSQDFITRSAERSAQKYCPTPPRVVGLAGTGIMAREIIREAMHNCPEMTFKVKASSAARAEEFKAHYPEDTRVEASHDFSIFSDCDLVIEAIVEDAAKKRALLTELEKHVKDDCIIATNTSSLELINLGQDLSKPDRFVGTHFFYPVDKMQLVEVISHPSTSQKASATALSFVTTLKKTPVSVKDSTGFLVNRLLCCVLLEAGRLLEDGVPFNWIEDAAIQFGLPMGPFTLLDELGLPLCFSVASELYRTFGERFKTGPTMDRTAAEGFTGKQSGQGLYVWDEGGRKLHVNEKFLSLNGLTLSEEKPSPEEVALIQKRLLMPMLDEAARCLEEKVVRKPRELDLALVVGTGYPAFRGGPLRYCDHLGIEAVVKDIEMVYAMSGSGVKRSPCKLLLTMKESGRRFYSSGAEA